MARGPCLSVLNSSAVLLASSSHLLTPCACELREIDAAPRSRFKDFNSDCAHWFRKNARAPSRKRDGATRGTSNREKTLRAIRLVLPEQLFCRTTRQRVRCQAGHGLAPMGVMASPDMSVGGPRRSRATPQKRLLLYSPFSWAARNDLSGRADVIPSFKVVPEDRQARTGPASLRTRASQHQPSGLVSPRGPFGEGIELIALPQTPTGELRCLPP